MANHNYSRIIIVLLILACTNWSGTFNIKFFSDLNTKIMAVKIKDFEIFKNIFGTIEEFGSWYYAEMAVMNLLAALLIGRFFRMKHRDVLSYMAEGTKKCYHLH